MKLRALSVLLSVGCCVQVACAEALSIPKPPAAPKPPGVPGRGGTSGGGPGGDYDIPHSPGGNGAGSGSGIGRPDPFAPNIVYPGGNPGVGGRPPSLGSNNLGSYAEDGQTPFSKPKTEGKAEAWTELLDDVDDVLSQIIPSGSSGPSRLSTTAPSQLTTRKYTWTSGLSLVTTTKVFNPARPLAACNALYSISLYCGGGGASCACYSGAYYVPEQWNSLAHRCASATCDISDGDSPYCNSATFDAAESTSYCHTNLRNAASTRFGAVAAVVTQVDTPTRATAVTPMATPTYPTGATTVSAGSSYGLSRLAVAIMMTMPGLFAVLL